MSLQRSAQTQTTVVPSSGILTPIGFDSVQITGGFWKTKQDINARGIIPHALEWETRVGWIDNFRHVVEGTIASKRRGREFADSDVYKLIEAMTWEIGRSGSEDLEAQVQRLGALIEAVQEKDGYLDTHFGHDGQDGRYTDFEWGHELYCFGHLIQAAVARLRIGRDIEDVIVRIALRVADHVCDTFGEGGLEKIPGHPEIEVALAELARATGKSQYLTQAKVFIDRRGHGLLEDIEWGRAYYQDDIPVREADALRGHSVRALYLTAGAIDVAVETGDRQLFDVAKKQFDHTWATRTYLTGGMGSHHQDEAFGVDFELPPDRAYSETCAAIAAVMVAWRLLLATGDEHYADVIERCLFNVVATSPSEDGHAFFYANTLHRRVPSFPADPTVASPRADSLLRAPWFDVSCCPTNVARTLASLGTLLATTDDDGIQLHQYAPSFIHTQVAGHTVRLRVETEYPSDGRVSVTMVEGPESGVALRVRIPEWATNAQVDGVTTSPGAYNVEDGIHPGQTVSIDLDIKARITSADPRVDAVRGCIAIERGPLVYCLESVDLLQGSDVNSVTVDPESLEDFGDEGVWITVNTFKGNPATWPYTVGVQSAEPPVLSAKVPLRPYNEWGNRGTTTMRVWLPIDSL
ncbi:beta-L-arabinofuranosidase domain-containing protein [Schaalia sp. ZJ1691]|uniref:glycoside hydrolase family 127 protein n=1 Tax=Schaalia sp. ZJ1691 TaxID=2709404 RepID=UPI0013E9FA08|nr:beta-L-arabinofuranosidase domain-containing protein [Schaalia sp. ZJ1691]